MQRADIHCAVVTKCIDFSDAVNDSDDDDTCNYDKNNSNEITRYDTECG